MRKALAPMLFGDETPREPREDVVSPKKPSPNAIRKARTKKRSMAPRFALFKPYWLIYRPSFETPSPRILRVLWQQQTEPSALQQRAFDLLKNVPTA